VWRQQLRGCRCAGAAAVRGEALLLAESLSVPDFVGVMDDVKNGEIKTQGKVIDHITEDQEECCGFDEHDFPGASSDGRVIVVLSYP
jgi:hypothetical protein